ncbi:hypothetical protein [Glycocaulis sp.]|uniref:hypothetical protein n=1 Tax=Glycocaulis sp. TaxID=1969725 RepID=UPI003F705E65
MEHHLDRRVILSEDSEYKNLYKWSLQELDEEGAKVGRDLVPWVWGLDFTATELVYNDGLTIEPDYSSDDEEMPIVTRKRRRIRAKLRPGSPQEWHRNRHPSYSMFGTDRTITAFELSIEPLAEDEEQDSCRVWGSVSYTMDIDFRDETTDDAVTFHLYVRPETFEHYVRTVLAAEVDAAVLYVKRVAGFYSDWSPAISTDNIKVLTGNEKDHPVELLDGSEIVPPRLGEVGEVSLTLVRKLTFEQSAPEADEDDDWQDELVEVPPDKALVAAQRSAKANVQTVALLTSLGIAAWVIAALLLLILVT